MLKKLNLALLIFVLGFCLRFYNLGQNPPSLNWDEAALGYNAYSILKTGRDEYGSKFPLYLRSFDDYKPPLYTYLTVPSVALFDLNDFAVRLPSALLGSFAVLITYLLVFEVFKHRKIAVLSSYFLAISPWHVQFSRVAFEANSAIFWSVLAVWAFFKGLKSAGFLTSLWMSLATAAFCLSLYTYHNARVFVPLLVLAIIILYHKEISQIKKHLVLPITIAVLTITSLFPIALSDAGQVRFKGTAVFGDLSPLYKESELILDDEKAGIPFVGKVLHNRRFVYLPIITENYLSHFRPSFLFFEADMDRHHAPLTGLLYIWDIPFIIAGFYFLLRKKYAYKTKIIVFWWFAIAPVASSVTQGVPHALRAENYLPIYQVITAVGFYNLIVRPSTRRWVIIAVSLLILNLYFYLHQYHVHLPLEFSESWKFGRKEAVFFSDAKKTDYDRVIVSTKLEQPYMFWLFYLKYNPNIYLQEGGTKSGGFNEEGNRFDKYEFKSIDYINQSRENNTLFVGVPKDFPGEANILKKINYLDGEPAIYIAE